MDKRDLTCKNFTSLSVIVDSMIEWLMVSHLLWSKSSAAVVSSFQWNIFFTDERCPLKLTDNVRCIIHQAFKSSRAVAYVLMCVVTFNYLHAACQSWQLIIWIAIKLNIFYPSQRFGLKQRCQFLLSSMLMPFTKNIFLCVLIRWLLRWFLIYLVTLPSHCSLNKVLNVLLSNEIWLQRLFVKLSSSQEFLG